MKRLLALFTLAAASTSPEIRYFRFVRPLEQTPAQSKQTCVVLDAALYAHAAPGLADVRLYHDRAETPYLIAMSDPASTSSDRSIEALNLGERGGQTVFDAAMPGGRFSDLELKVTGQDFIATVTVSGSQQQTGPATKIGDYTIFDFTRQKLGRSTVLHLPRSDFRYLHFRIGGPLRPENVAGLSVQGLPTEQPAYTTVTEATRATQKDHTSVIEFTVPANIPVERIVFSPGATPTNFSRDVTIDAEPAAGPTSREPLEPSPTVTGAGNLLRIHLVQNGRHIDQEQLAIDAPHAHFASSPSKWTIRIDNGDNAPLVPDSVRLEMLKRYLCFEGAGGNYTVYYGDTKLNSPRYDLGQFFGVRPDDAAQAVAGPEQPNPDYQPRPDDRPFTERHPLLLWIALALVIGVLGAIALRSAKTARPQNP